jgi:hypothetical protein
MSVASVERSLGQKERLVMAAVKASCFSLATAAAFLLFAALRTGPTDSNYASFVPGPIASQAGLSEVPANGSDPAKAVGTGLLPGCEGWDKYYRELLEVTGYCPPAVGPR